mmetsp:Transcript_32102/g.87951  ORF Transcript_32102/g.87951 Transcript_32102/m.87951 type:complete len:208 (+) Transcript_32102:1001-1624(+)|eukprot:2622521-Prymnesium_polylepis.2
MAQSNLELREFAFGAGRLLQRAQDKVATTVDSRAECVAACLFRHLVGQDVDIQVLDDAAERRRARLPRPEPEVLGLGAVSPGDAPVIPKGALAGVVIAQLHQKLSHRLDTLRWLQVPSVLAIELRPDATAWPAKLSNVERLVKHAAGQHALYCGVVDEVVVLPGTHLLEAALVDDLDLRLRRIASASGELALNLGHVVLVVHEKGIY